jgi:hypothetical protein
MTKTISLSTQAITTLKTPQLLKGGLYLTWGASLLMLIATLSGVQGQRHSLKTVGKDAAPSIIDAQHIKDNLADMGASAVNELLVQAGQNPKAVANYEARRQEITQLLVKAAENITYGDGERIPIETMQSSLQDYIALIQQARDFHQRGNQAGAVASYLAAAEIMDKRIQPAADALDKANLEILDRTYTQQQSATARALLLVVISDLLLIGVLVGMQIFLNRRMRRILNPMLLGATAIASIFLGYTIWTFLSASHHLKVAKEDAFTSIHALQKTRAFAYSANRDESRYLLDPAHADRHQQAFFDKVAKMATLPKGQTFETVAAASAQGNRVDGFTGFLADELNNVTFAGEREAAVDTLSKWAVYMGIDQQLRQLQRIGKLQEAIALCVGNNPGQSNWAFAQFDEALKQTLEINQQAFDKAVDQGFKDMEGFEITTPVVVVAIALLTLFGLLPRMKEYSA